MFVHHATARRASTLGLVLAVEGTQVLVRFDGVLICGAESGRAALAEAEEMLELSGYEGFAELAAECAEGDEAEGDEAVRSNLAKQVAKYRGRYAAVAIGAGRENCGDAIAELMLPVTAELLSEVAAANDLDAGRWAHLNFGHAKMCLSNALRGRVNRGEQVVVLGVVAE